MLMAFKAGQDLLRHFSINRHGGKGEGECGVERENGDHHSMQMCGVAALMSVVSGSKHILQPLTIVVIDQSFQTGVVLPQKMLR